MTLDTLIAIILAALATPCNAPSTPLSIPPPVAVVKTPLPAAPEPVASTTATVYSVATVAMTEPSRKWILTDATWKRMNDSHLGVDLNVLPGQEYVGVRVTLPFGS